MRRFTGVMSRVTKSPLRRIAQGVGVFAALVASLLLGSQPAFASSYWQEISTNSNWHCGYTWQMGTQPSGVVAQTCIVANSSGWAQAVLVVSNNSGQTITIGGMVMSNMYLGTPHPCNSSLMHSGFQRGCLGPSNKNVGCNGLLLTAKSTVHVNGQPHDTASVNYRHYC
ncbi:hypothetical protein [Streptomyces sp. NPDC001820]|uniref:hypothetical protein n=1 Tax=Streptomyces sp. NPDC001820 TaxID=3364613 RepID=UPI0036A2CADA